MKKQTKETIMSIIIMIFMVLLIASLLTIILLFSNPEKKSFCDYDGCSITTSRYISENNLSNDDFWKYYGSCSEYRKQLNMDYGDWGYC